jgi:hypothetical protein
MSQHAQRRSELAWRARSGGFSRRWPWVATLAFAIAFLGTLAVAMLQGEKPFFNDSGGYWELGTTFAASGHFSLLNFSDPARGYLLPLIDYGLQQLAADFAWTASSIAKLFNVLAFALIGTVLGPAFVKTVWPTQPSWGLTRRLVLTALLLVFWSGFLNFPLSDFPGLATGLLTLIAVARTDSPGWMFVAGAALAATIDIRVAYVPLLAMVPVCVVWAWIQQRGGEHASAARRALCVGLLILGFVLVSLPQSLSAHRYHGTWSFFPGASVLEPASAYYTTGLPAQAFDTDVVNDEARVGMTYGYPAGRRLLEHQKEGKVTSTSQYIGLFVSHPIVMGGLLIGHVVNGLDPLYSTPYVENIHNYGRVWGRIAGFLLVFLALLRLLWPAARRRLGPGRLRFLLALSLCCVTTLPSAMERRYMLPVYLVCYVVALMPGWPSPLESAAAGLRRFQTPAVLAVSFLAFASVVWYITGEAISHLVIR